MRRLILVTAFTAVMLLAAVAQAVVRTGPADEPISRLVAAPAGAETVYVSGQTASPRGAPKSGDTQAQTAATLLRLQDVLKTQGLTLADVVMLRVYLAGDPKLGGKADRPGMARAYGRFFGTPAQPNKPARTTIQVAGMGDDALVEIDAQAVRTP